MYQNKLVSFLAVIVGAFITPEPVFSQIYWKNQSPAGINDAIWGVTYANGTFAAVTDQGNLLTSADGLTWSNQAIDPGIWLVSIAYGDGLWVVVGDKGTILTSSDLKAWTKANSGTINKLNYVTFDAVATPPVADLPSPFIVVGDGGTILSSTDAVNWIAVPSGVTVGLSGIASTFLNAVACGQNGEVLSSVNHYGSPIMVETGLTVNLNGIIAGGPLNPGLGYFVAIGDNGVIAYSAAVIQGGEMPSSNWSIASVPNTTATLRGIVYGGGYYVVAGDKGTILTSQDVMNWTQRCPGNDYQNLSTATLLSAAYSEPLQRYVVTGEGGTILVSNATPTVFANVSARGYVSSNQTFIGGFYVLGSAARTVLIRADGPVLSTFGVPNPLPDPVLTVYNSVGTVVATNTGWGTNTLWSTSQLNAAFAAAGAFTLPNQSADSVLLLSLQPGTYTVQITSAKGNSGTALFEAYTD